MITVQNLFKNYDTVEVLKGISTTINSGEIISIIGPSGCGKSTFLRCLNLLEKPTSGEIIFDDVNTLDKKTNINEIRKKMGMVFQNFNLFDNMNILDNLMVGQVKLLKKTKAEAKKTALELLKTVGLAEKAQAYPDELSGGQKQRIAIARCLSMEPNIILFDEPTSALDPTMVGEVMAVIRKLASEGMTMAIVTHEMDFARDVSSRVFYMDEGLIYEEGSPNEIFNNPQKEKTRIFINRIKSFDYSITSADFDFIDMMNSLSNFCFKHAVLKSTANKLQLVVEEMVMNVLLPLHTPLEISVHFSENKDSVEVIAVYGGEEYSPLCDESDNLSATIIHKIAKNIEHSFDGKNKLEISW